MDQNPFNEFIVSLMSSEFMSNSVEIIIYRVIKVALVMGSIFYFINLGYNYISSSIGQLSGKKDEGFFKLNELIRTVVLLICISFYAQIARVITEGVDFMNSFTAPASKQSEWLDKQAKEYKKMDNLNIKTLKIKALEDKLKDPEATENQKDFAKKQLAELEAETQEDEQSGGFFGIFEKIYAFVRYLPMLFIHGVTGLILGIIRIIILLMAVVVFKVLLILGPLAFAFSILPPFRDKIDEWFGTLIGVGLVFTTINILDHLVYEIFFQMVEQGYMAGAYDLAMLGFDITIIVCYILCFWLTSKWVGKGDAGRVLSKAVGLTTMAVGAGLAKAGISAGGVGGGSGIVGNVASAGKDAIKDDE